MVETVYAKWISGEADKAEMAKLNTAIIALKIKISHKLVLKNIKDSQLSDF
jgi:hypothetical protein